MRPDPGSHRAKAVRLTAVAAGLAVALLPGCVKPPRPASPPTPPEEGALSKALACADVILAATPNVDYEYDATTLDRMHAATDELASLGEGALPGLDRLLHVMLDRSLDTKRASNDGFILDVILARMTYPNSKWGARGSFALKWGTAGDETKAVRRPWLRPFILKALTHGFAGRYKLELLWALWFHVPDPADDLVAIAEDAQDPSLRAFALEYLSKISPLPREQLADAVVSRMSRDYDPAPRTMAIALAIKFKVKRALPDLVSCASKTDEADISIVQDLVDKRFLKTNQKHDDWWIGPRIGELAAFAYQEITGEDVGFTNCYDSREKMPEIIKKLQADPRWRHRHYKL